MLVKLVIIAIFCRSSLTAIVFKTVANDKQAQRRLRHQQEYLEDDRPSSEDEFEDIYTSAVDSKWILLSGQVNKKIRKFSVNNESNFIDGENLVWQIHVDQFWKDSISRKIVKGQSLTSINYTSVNKVLKGPADNSINVMANGLGFLSRPRVTS